MITKPNGVSSDVKNGISGAMRNKATPESRARKYGSKYKFLLLSSNAPFLEVVQKSLKIR